MRVRILMILGATALALGLAGMTLVLAQETAPALKIEVEHKAAAAPVVNPPSAIRAAALTPLFVGVDERIEFTYLIGRATAAPAIVLTKTVGLDANACAVTNAVTVLPGAEVTYCYEVTNTGILTLTRHTLSDDRLGSILVDFPYSLAPGASAFITQSATITETTVNTAAWTAFNPGPTDEVTATATATVTVSPPAIVLTKTVGLDANTCAVTNAVTVLPGAEVTYCYEVTNTGILTLTRHTLSDDRLGSILFDFPYSLAPGASAFITQSATITETTVNTATWTAFNPGPTDEVTATATATVETIVEAPDVTVAPASLSAELPPDRQMTTTVIINNSGNAALNWVVAFAPSDCNVPGAPAWASAAPANGATLPGDQSEVVVTFDSTGAAAEELTGVLCLGSNDPDEPLVVVPLTLTVGQYLTHLPAITGSPDGE